MPEKSSSHILKNYSSSFKIFPREILKVLAYFDVFSYPLRASEIAEYVNCSYDPSELEVHLDLLSRSGLITESNGFYYLSHRDDSVVERRRTGNAQAAQVLPKAMRSARKISRFPFVEGICFSGSLSKNFFDKDSDVDFFIVTRSGRLWLCRSLLIAYKKLVLFNSKKYFCVNYFVSEDSLSIPDRNIFTATEIKTLRPAYNYEVYRKFHSANAWTNEFIPNKGMLPAGVCLKKENRWFKSLLEKVFSGKIGTLIDTMLFRFTLKRWRKKFSHFTTDDFDLNMRSRKSVSKHHPNGFQVKVLREFERRLQDLEEQLTYVK
jgi:hypothetical protein